MPSIPTHRVGEEVGPGQQDGERVGDGIDNVALSAWRFTSWTGPYRALLASFGTDAYHLDHHVAGLDHDEREVTLRFTNGRVEHADLVVFADGISSTGRRRLLPEVTP